MASVQPDLFFVRAKPLTASGMFDKRIALFETFADACDYADMRASDLRNSGSEPKANARDYEIGEV